MSTKNSRKANTSDPGSENSSENEGPFSQNSKRQKLDAGGASSSSTTQQQLMLAGRLKSGEDGYVDGSIVRVTLKNFVTYEACEFRPGPHLNMIVGPNGTGKSTAVCAMALGLGGNTSVCHLYDSLRVTYSDEILRFLLLGRAKDISEFVKTGKDNASIEIELKHRGRGGNIVIKRQIKKAKNNSIWQINGTIFGLVLILAILHSLRLCKFLFTI
ncbi:LOW QUALITY PROTEIN: structural maintenance of chromosomes protein 5-like protein [Endogone sp. FLAS-F59071]|nr:LOW QUALITY PROTEIN: structural maintenance of chromosomes protein 5-like protein [Endogone sp. FLAS-F59071]|eukprot:RUS15767.1 LOW QUALITY PROTEIN: structural maintenance of chromosomes protein 5-like protein [Endogone sp. FLAS-F59071]